MRTQISQPQRDQIRKILRKSIESKHSKTKKLKPAPQQLKPTPQQLKATPQQLKATHMQPRRDYDPLRTPHGSQLKDQTAQLLKQLTLSRVIDKLEVVERLADKCLDRPQRKAFAELFQLIIKEEQLRSLIEGNQRKNNRQKVKQQKDYLQHILSKQQNLIQQSHSPRAHTLTSMMNSGVSINYLAREMSPKVKFDSFFFSDLGKKTVDRESYYLSELQNKDKVVKRLFQRIQTLQQGNSRCSFKQNFDSLNFRLLDGQRNASRIRELQQLLSRQAKEHRELSHNYRLDIQTHKSDYEKLFEGCSQLSKKYRELEEEFQQQMRQKEDWERKFSKLTRQHRANQENNSNLLAEVRAKVTQLLKYDIMEMRSMQKVMQNRVKDDLEFIRETALSQTHCLSTVFNRQKQQQAKKLCDLSHKCQKLQNLLQSYQQKVFKLQLQNQQLLSQLSSKAYNLQTTQLISNVVSQFIAPQPTAMAVSKCSTSPDTVQLLGRNSRQTGCLQILHPSVQNIFSFAIECQNSALQSLVKANCRQHVQGTRTSFAQTGCQTETRSFAQSAAGIKIEPKACRQMGTQSQQNQTPAQTETEHGAQLALKRVVGYGCKPCKTTSLAIRKQVYHQIDSESFRQNVQIYTDRYQEQLEQDFRIIQDCPAACQPSDILRLLQMAEECTVVPQMTLLREQLAMHRQQIQRLRHSIRAREKEEQNVFNFRL